ncbi:hypothetical protein C7271_04800 [filamentous cyanobacterium CCP5]|nr:hypothetical protein C7271_04800 [filamentous cyanobacterium CCP5]
MVPPVLPSDWYQLPPSLPEWSEERWLERGYSYYQQIQPLIPYRHLRFDIDSAIWRRRLVWIGQNIHRLNQRLWELTQSCFDCFLTTCPPIRPWAFPLGLVLQPDLKLAGLCNLDISPIALIIDVGQISPEDWLRVVVHEFAHAVSGAGHGPDFQSALTHLCIGLGFPPPVTLSNAQGLRQWPPYRPSRQTTFWSGEPTYGSSNLII